MLITFIYFYFEKHSTFRYIAIHIKKKKRKIAICYNIYIILYEHL
nr:MAG TPA: hypothetical protein [Bacteriophage sp.]